MRWAFVVGWLVVGLLVPADVAQAQMVSALQIRDSSGAIAAIPFEELAGYAGVTICYKGRSYAFISTSLDAMQEAETRAHEAKHVEQMARFGNDCGAFDRWYATPAGGLVSEAEAYAAGICKWVQLGGDGVSRRRSVTEKLEARFGTANLLTAIQTVEQYTGGCGLTGQ